MIPASWRVETLTEGGIFLVDSIKETKLILTEKKLLYSHGRGVMVN